jgi:hypothetical protein
MQLIPQYQSGNPTKLEDVYRDAVGRGYTGKKDIAELQRWKAETDPQSVINYYNNGIPLNAKHIELLKQQDKEVFQKTGIDPNKPSASYTSEEKALLKQASQVAQQENFILEGFKDGLWDYRFPTQGMSITPKQGTYGNISAPIPNIATTPTEQGIVAPQEEDNNIVSEADRKRMNTLLLPDQTPMQPWGMLAPAMTTQTIYAPKYNEIDPTQQLMELERMNIATSQNIANLPDNQRAAANLALDANSNDAKNKLMAETERYNQMARERTEGAEAQQKTQQSQANVVAFQNYQQLLGNELESNEADWRNFYNRLQSNQMNNYLTVQEINRSNQFSPNITFTGSGYEVINTPTFTNDASKMNLTQEKKKTAKAKKGGTFKCNRFGK